MIAAQENAATSREEARKKREQASRARSATTVRMARVGAERKEKKAAAAEQKVAKVRKDIATVDKSIASKTRRSERLRRWSVGVRRVRGAATTPAAVETRSTMLGTWRWRALRVRRFATSRSHHLGRSSSAFSTSPPTLTRPRQQ